MTFVGTLGADAIVSSGQGCQEQLLKLSIVLTSYPEERRHDQTYDDLVAHLDGRRIGIKETEAGVATCQEIQMHKALFVLLCIGV